MSKFNGLTATAIDADQMAEILAASHIERHFTLDNGGIRAFVLTGHHEGDFLAFQCAGTGEAFVVQTTSSPDESVHFHAREVLQARY